MSENYFSKWVKENFYPTSIVFSTEKAKKIIAKNNLTPSEFLRPFGVFKEIKYMQNERFSIAIKNYRMDFYDAEQYKKIPQSSLVTLTDNLLLNPKNYPEWTLSEVKSKNYLTSVFSRLKNFSFPWFNEYEKMFLEFLHFNEYELYQQPLSYIYVCSIDDDIENVVPKREKDKIPRLIYEEIFESDMPVLILILNDISDKDNVVTGERKSSYINNYKKKFRDYYMLYWEVNINDPSTKPINEDIWKEFLHKCDVYSRGLNYNPDDVIRGEYISKEERAKFKNTLLDYMNKYVIQVLKEKIRSIDNEMVQTKKGLRNSFMGLFQKNERMEYNKYYQIYSLTPREKREYISAIIQFYFRNYEGAYETLGYFMGDVKSRSPNHYNAALELKTIIYNILNPDSKELDGDDAYKHYLKSHQFPQSLRALLIYIKLSEQKTPTSFLSYVLIKAVMDIPHSLTKNERGACLPIESVIPRLNPLLFEKLSIYFIVPPEKKMRRFALYTFLAGYAFKGEKVKLTRYCLNCYGNIFPFIDNKNGSFIRAKEFLNKQMGFMCKELSNYEGGLRFFQNCVELERYYVAKSDSQYENMIDCLRHLLDSQDQGTTLGSYNVNSLTVPEVDNTSLLIIEEQDKIISEEKKAHGGWLKFKKFDIVPLKKIYISLSPEDIISLRNLDNIIEKKQNFSNFYSKRNFQQNVNNKMYVRFTIKNPLMYVLRITNMKLICEFTTNAESTTVSTNEGEGEIEYQSISLDLKPSSSQEIELYCKPLVSGHCIIKGVEITLDNIAVIKHYFNKKSVSKLYNYRVKRRNSTAAGAERKGSTSSQGRNSNASSQGRSSNASSNYKPSFSRKSEITFDIIDNEADIIVEFPNGKVIDCYKGEFILMPITIKNNSKAKIKRFCFFFQEEPLAHSNVSVLCEYIYKEIELFQDKNSQTIYVPIVPRYEGEMYIKILVKFEEEIKFKENECRRYMIKLNVKPSIDFEVYENVIHFANDEDPKKKKITYSLDTIASIQNTGGLREISVGTKVYYGKDFYREDCENFNWETIAVNDSEKLYHRFIFMKKLIYNQNSLFSFFGFSPRISAKIRNEELNQILSNTNFEFIDPKFSEDEVQSHIKTRLATVLLKNKLIFTWSCLENETNRKINGLFFYQPPLKTPPITASLLRQLMKKIFTLETKVTKLNDEQSMIELQFQIDKKSLKEIAVVAWCEICVEEGPNISSISWFGLRSYKIQNKKDKKDKEEEKGEEKEGEKISLSFSAVTTLKGRLDVNRTLVKIYQNSKDVPIVLNNIPYPVVVDV